MLADEIEKSQRLVRTDAYQMSIGEVVNMYKEGDLIISPEFQRLFRWEAGQKSKLIESLLLGIPLPPIFVFETQEAKWELIDGLQRLSTILEFMGILIDPDTEVARPPSYMEATKYLPSLSNVVWEKSNAIKDIALDEQVQLEKSQQLAIRRARLGVEILKRPSDNNTKYDLFQRLNAAGTPANAQELRNCVVIMVNSSYYRFLRELAELPAFQTVIDVTDEQVERQKHLEYTCRFMTHAFVPYDGKLDVEEFIDESMRGLAEKNETVVARETFIWTFELLNKLYRNDALRRIEKGRAYGRIGLSAFEIIAVGVARNMSAIMQTSQPEQFVRQRIENFWQADNLAPFFSSGMRGTTRIQRTIPFGEGWFRP